MRTDELDYNLPEDLIAQEPVTERDEARLMVVNRASETISIDVFHRIAAYLRTGDCLVLNQTRVIRARLRGRKPTGGHVEIFLLRELNPGRWEALVRPSAKIKPGTPVRVGEGLEAEVGEKLGERTRAVRFDCDDVLAELERSGIIPLPPYIKREEPDARDLTRYQTVYATQPGAVAAPTAGLHYTQRVFDSLRDAGISWTYLTLHVGYGTFQPIAVERVEDHVLEAENYEVSDETRDRLNAVRAEGGRVAAVGTTSTRVLETCFREGRFEAGTGVTAHYIYPPYNFRAVDLLQTNFHLPRSSLLALVYAFGGVDLMRRAYDQAIAERMRFYSYGDTMLIV